MHVEDDNIISHNITKTIEAKEKRNGKVNANDVFLLANRLAKDESVVKADKPDVVAKALVEQCFYNLKNKQLSLTMDQILKRCEGLYQSYQLDLCFAFIHWDTIKSRIERRVRSEWGFKNEYVWEREKTLSSALENFMLTQREDDKEEKGYYSCPSSSSFSSNEDNSEKKESKGIFYYLIV
ncbi:hypothetical protein RFI_32175 [Reticulomyxa filosa]|uniref:Uncharacterized protein n=1 Tax=Reticulomyxa filosa TaxID=46433 RepID=X6LWV5_RETFI|nr:hypothetical protein RFI_32175 [Reticulomyxa filosa]|eukprot:ETO05220.1 hypothetical protein RFI_32175 [Reticulomyxa filosa]